MVADIKISEEATYDIPCRKCRVEMVDIMLSPKDGLCQKCFMLYVRHKFRATLGITKLIPKNARVMVLADGSLQSVAMLDMIKYGVEDELFKKLHVVIGGVLTIDNLELCSITGSSKVELLEKYRKSLMYLNMPLYLASVGSEEIKSFETESIAENDLSTTFTKKFQSLKSLSTRQDYLHQLKRKLIHIAAKRLECPFVFTPEIGVDIAERLLTNISLGRGAGTALDISFCDDRIEDVRIVRPMRDLVPVEVEHYIRLNNLEVVELPKYGLSSGESASIENLTHNFVTNLQDKFASTVSTVSRTGDRLKVTTYDVTGRCKVCHLSLDCASSETLFAVEYSKIVAQHADSHLEDTDFIQDEALKKTQGVDGVVKDLCYGCRNILLDTDDPDVLDDLLS